MQDHAEHLPALSRGFRIVPFQDGAEGFVVKEWYTRGETVELCLIMSFFLTVGLLGTIAMLSLLFTAQSFLGVSILVLMTAPWLLIAVWAFSRIFTRRLVLFDLEPAWRLEIRRMAGRFVLWRKVVLLSAFGEVYLTSSHGMKTGWSHTVGCRRGKRKIILTKSSSRGEAITFACWLGKKLGMPVRGIPEELSPRSENRDTPTPVIRSVSEMGNPLSSGVVLPGGDARN